MPAQRVCSQCQAVFANGEQFCAFDGATLEAGHAKDVTSGDPMLGQILGERYVLRQVLGQGGMGVVYLAEHEALERLFAIKVLSQNYMGHPTAARRFEREARAAARVAHPHIVKVYDYGQSPAGLPYLVMEYLPGITLAEYVRKQPGGKPHLGQTVDIILAVAQALQHAHSLGVVHRDVKTDNILLTHHEGQTDFVKILDFGIARILTQSAVTAYGVGAPGTPVYMAPEMLRPNYEETFGPAVDVYALGIMLFELVVGKKPFAGSDYEVLYAHLHTAPPRLSALQAVPAALDALVAKMLAKEPRHRPPAEHVVTELMNLRPELPPRSIRSILAQQTVVLNQKTELLNLHNQRTVLLDPKCQPQAITLRLQPQLFQLDELYAELESVSAALHRSSLTMMKKCWGQEIPEELKQLLQHIARCEAAEEELGLQLALLCAQESEDQQRSGVRKAALHQQILAKSEALNRLPPSSSAERRMLAQQILAIERLYAKPEPPGEAALKLAANRPRIEELRTEIHRSRRKLAVSILHVYRLSLGTLGSKGRPALQDLTRELENALDKFDEQTAKVLKLIEYLPAIRG